MVQLSGKVIEPRLFVIERDVSVFIKHGFKSFAIRFRNLATPQFGIAA